MDLYWAISGLINCGFWQLKARAVRIQLDECLIILAVVYQGNQAGILILNVCFLVAHFPLAEQIPQVPLPQKPFEEFFEHPLHLALLVVARDEQFGDVAGSGHSLDMVGIVVFDFVVVALMAAA